MTVRRLVWDASALVHPGLIDRLDVLGHLASGTDAEPWENFTTAAVVEELTTRRVDCPAWLEVVHVDAIAELVTLATWIGRVATPTHSKGEATVLSWAECHGAVAIVDDNDARRVAARHRLPVHGLLWVIAQGVGQGKLTVASAASLTDQLIGSGARYPFEIGGFARWARQNGLLPAVKGC